MKSLVPYIISLQDISRDYVIQNHTRSQAQELFCSFIDQEDIAFFDGTYIYILKSNNFQFERKSYSLHKGRPHVKPMVITSTDGNFLSDLGPYLANKMMPPSSNTCFVQMWKISRFQADDIFVVDRGFRDLLDVLTDWDSCGNVSPLN